MTEQGLSARYGGQKGTVRWEGARLFAMYNTWGAQKNGSSITYELSSATDIARWTWVLRPNLLILLSLLTKRDCYHALGRRAIFCQVLPAFLVRYTSRSLDGVLTRARPVEADGKLISAEPPFMG